MAIFDFLGGRKKEFIGDVKGLEVALSDPLSIFPGSEPYNPSKLVGRKGFKLFDEMSNDEQLKMALDFKRQTVIGAGWQIKSPGDLPDDWEPTAFVQEQLDNLTGTFEQALLEIMSSFDYGFSVTEKVYLPDGNRINLEALKTRAPHSFYFKQDEYGNIDALQQEQGFRRRDMPIEKFIVYTYQGRFGNPYGRSDFEAAYRSWWLKTNVYKWMGMYLERYGIPPIAAFTDTNLGNEKLTILQNILKNMQAATSIVLPFGVGDDKGVELWTPENTSNQAGEVFIPVLDKLDRDMARAILVPGLLGVTPDETLGSQAKARVSFDAFMLMVEFLRKQVAETVITEQLIRPLVEMNFNVTEYPVFEFLPISDEDMVETFKTWAELAKSSVVSKGEDDEAYIRASLGMPELVETEEPMEDEPPEDDPEEDDEEMAEFALSRQPNEYERVVNFQQVENTLTKWEDQLVREAGRIYRRSMERILSDLSKAESVETFRIDSIPGGQQFESQLRRFLVGLFNDGRNQFKEEMPSRDYDANFIPQDALAFLREKAIYLAATKNEAILAAVRQALMTSVQNGETTQGASKRIRDVFLPHIGDPGVIRDDDAIAAHRTEAIARTESTAAYNQGRLVQARQVPRLMRGMMYSAIMDSRTTPVCRELDGKVFELEDPKLDQLSPPRHVNCRSLLVPVTVNQTVQESDYITASQAGRAEDLSGKGF